MLAACRRGLDALDEHRATLGSSELRALATRHGDELSALALRHAAHSGPRTLLEWSERRRATALSQPPVHPPDDAELAQATWRPCATPGAAWPRRRPKARRRRPGLTTSARGWRRRSGDVPTTSRVRRPRRRRFQAERLVDSLDDTTFVELVDVDGVLHALVARAGRVRHVVVGDTAAAEQAVAFARFALRQAARGRPADLDDVGRRLETALLGDAVRRLGDGPVVVSPTEPAARDALVAAAGAVPTYRSAWRRRRRCGCARGRPRRATAAGCW